MAAGSLTILGQTVNSAKSEVRADYRSSESGDRPDCRSLLSPDQPKSPRREDWADEIAAFANTRGGVLLCGVTDSGDVQGMSCTRMDALKRLIREVCLDSCSASSALSAIMRLQSEITTAKAARRVAGCTSLGQPAHHSRSQQHPVFPTSSAAGRAAAAWPQGISMVAIDSSRWQSDGIFNPAS